MTEWNEDAMRKGLVVMRTVVLWVGVIRFLIYFGMKATTTTTITTTVREDVYWAGTECKMMPESIVCGGGWEGRGGEGRRISSSIRCRM